MATEKLKIINPYDSYEMLPQKEAGGNKGNDFLEAVKSLQVGFGSKVLRIDRDGLWLGAEDFASAPFSVDMEGNLVATSLDLSGFLQVGDALSDIGLGNITGTYIANGTINTAKLNATAINGMTITGALVRTSSSGRRVQLNKDTNTLQIFDSAGNVRAESYENGFEFSTASETTAGRIFIESTFNNLQIQAVSSNLLLTAVGDVLFAPDNGGIQGFFSSTGLHLNDELDMNGNDIDMDGGNINYVNGMLFRARTSNPVIAGQFQYYNSGGTQRFQCQVGTFKGSVDLSAI